MYSSPTKFNLQLLYNSNSEKKSLETNEGDSMFEFSVEHQQNPMFFLIVVL